MANQYFLVENLVKSSTFIASSENAQYPLTNLLDDRRTKTYRTTSNSDTLVIDFGTLRSVNAFAIVAPSIGGLGLTSLTLELNVSNVWGSPLYSAPVTINFQHGFGSVILPSTYTVRYARLVMASSLGYCELPKIFLGEYASIGELTFEYPLVYKQNNNASVTKNRLGQKFFDEINSQKELTGSIQTMTKEELEPLLDILDYASFTLPIWLVFPEGNITTDNDRINGYYYLKDDPTLTFQAGNFWNTSLSFEEGT